jgi:hypothetical protein
MEIILIIMMLVIGATLIIQQHEIRNLKKKLEEYKQIIPKNLEPGEVVLRIQGSELVGILNKQVEDYEK